MAARIGRRFVTMIDFEQAKDKVMMGAERRSMVMTAEQKEMTAYHEAGHALVGMTLPKCDPVYKATIIPRGGALGMVMSLPEMDRLNMFKDECHQRLAMTMAGKAAEIHKYGPDSVSNGPAGDIQQASAWPVRWCCNGACPTRSATSTIPKPHRAIRATPAGSLSRPTPRNWLKRGAEVHSGRL